MSEDTLSADGPTRSPGEPASRRNAHVVDQLIAERAPRLAASPAWPVVSFLLRPLLNYRAARRMADAIAPLEGEEALEHVSRLLRLDARACGIARVPAQGACLVMANHPTGIADGIAMYDVLRPRRADLCFFANADSLRVCRGLDDVIVPVVWPAEKRTPATSRVTLRKARRAFDAGRAVVVFPAGALARRKDGRIQDPPWEHSAVALARRHAVPIVPVNVQGPFPRLFHLFDRYSSELRDITLFHELLNKVGGRYRLAFGHPIAPGDLEDDNEAVTARLKDHVERVLPNDPDARFS